MRRWLRRLAAALLLGPLAWLLLLRFVAAPVTPLMLLRSAQGYPMQYHPVPGTAIAPALAHAVIASEDNLFCMQSLGFDFPALWSQLQAWREGDRPRGASTITMQAARNVMLWPGRDPLRKVLEAWLTPQFALLWPKQRVMDVYLNIIEFGPGVYGAEAAAQHWFHKPAAALTQREAIRLALLLPAPLERSAVNPSPFLRERAAVIERRVAQLGALRDCVR